MANAQELKTVNRLLRDIMGNDIVFTEKMIALGSDFRQLLRVVSHASRQTITQNFIDFPSLALFPIPGFTFIYKYAS